MFWIKKFVRVVFEAILAPLCILLTVLVGSILLIGSPLVWKLVYDAPSKLPASAQRDGEFIATNLWTEMSYTEVSERLEGRKLHIREIRHYEDLQKKFTQLGVILVVLLAVLLLMIRYPRLNRILWLSLAWLAILSMLGTAWALHDWKDFFRTLHWWAFQDASWKVPKGCYSTQLYPYIIWKKAALITLSFSVSFYIILFFISRFWRSHATQT